MKTSFLSISLAILAAFLLSSFDFSMNGWEKLGERRVNLGLDHDQINVGLRDGTFSKLQIRVKNSGINLHKMVVHFGDGDKQNVEVRDDIRKGGQSRVIDLEGRRRIIKQVDFWYDTKGLVNDKAVVELWGR